MNFYPLIGDEKVGPRKEFFYFSDGGVPTGIRNGDWKMVFQEQRAHGFSVWQDPYFALRLPKIFNLRRDLFERADQEAAGYNNWLAERLFLCVPTQQVFTKFLISFKDFLPRQKLSAFNLDNVIEKFMPD
ncbi:arylsulfatase [Desulfocicer vacuolatum DSM 3385]|uniref:Arylsulfatase n=1 Tax=Desulfocicer vacuolatum DSM 3385 TaxID=1121400 RepID=A0A1W2CX66_9BACT|nr:hypothetical protein [Desulfocicer vacuolatum]SMC89813.1 arylsulfatase [Desulfocicer vacuolatum DSM 3385]